EHRSAPAGYSESVFVRIVDSRWRGRPDRRNHRVDRGGAGPESHSCADGGAALRGAHWSRLVHAGRSVLRHLSGSQSGAAGPDCRAALGEIIVNLLISVIRLALETLRYNKIR